jgi:hypothetical protein
LLPGALAVGLVAILGIAALGAGWLPPGSGGGPGARPAPRFADVTAASGLEQTYDGSETFSVGGGVAVLDCDDDGRPDLYLPGGANPAALFRNDGPTGGPLHVRRIADPATDLTRVTGAYPLDLDGDGRVDLAVLRIGENVLLRGLGGCRFERANERLGFIGGEAMTTAFSATWEGANRLPTLAFGNYLSLDESGESTTACVVNDLVRPATDGARYDTTIPLPPSFCALSMLFSDWSRTGRADLRVSNDRHYYDNAIGAEQLWRIAPGEKPRAYTAADGWAEVQVEGMGIASRDLTGDGLPEVYLTSQAANRLQTLTAGPARPTYGDIGLKLGVNVARPYAGDDQELPSTAWHPEFADVNDDGLIDLFVAKGNVSDQPDYARQDPPNLLIGQPDGTFLEGAPDAGIVRFDRGRGAALVDLDLDGLLDLVQVNYGQPATLWRNLGAGDPATGTPRPMGSWLAVRVGDPARPNRDAIGGWLEVRVGETIRASELTVGGGHGGGQLGWIHVGLGDAAGPDLRVRWPGGEVGPWLRAEAGRFVELERGATSLRPWTPPPP